MPEELTPEQVEQYLQRCSIQWIGAKQVTGPEVLAYVKKMERRVVSLAVAMADRGNPP